MHCYIAPRGPSNYVLASPRLLAHLPADETQQCADTATEHVRFLEEKAEADRAEHEAAVAALQQQLETAQSDLAAAKAALAEAQTAAAANLDAAAEAAAAELVRVQVGGRMVGRLLGWVALSA